MTPGAFAATPAPAQARASGSATQGATIPGAKSPEDEFLDSDQNLSPDSRKELRQLIEDARPEFAQRSPAVLGPAADRPVDYK